MTQHQQTSFHYSQSETTPTFSGMFEIVISLGRTGNNYAQFVIHVEEKTSVQETKFPSETLSEEFIQLQSATRAYYLLRMWKFFEKLHQSGVSFRGGYFTLFELQKRNGTIAKVKRPILLHFYLVS